VKEMKTNEGGSVASMALFVVGMVALIAACVVYLVKDDTHSKKWAEQTKAVVAENDKLKAEWEAALDTVKGLCANHNTLAEELTRQKEQLAKIQYAQTLPAKPLTLPSTINFTVVERRKVLQSKQVDDRGTLPTQVIDSKTPTTDAQIIKKVKKVLKQNQSKVKELSQ
jgi:hypothetical protein